MGDRVVDCARLESVCAERHRGFESPPIRRCFQIATGLRLTVLNYVSTPGISESFSE